MTKFEISVLDISDETLKRYEALAQKYGKTREFYLANAIETSIDRLEFEFEILQASKDIASGKMKTHSLEEVGEELGLEG